MSYLLNDLELGFHKRMMTDNDLPHIHNTHTHTHTHTHTCSFLPEVEKGAEKVGWVWSQFLWLHSMGRPLSEVAGESGIWIYHPSCVCCLRPSALITDRKSVDSLP
jgi:hypothetical protein